MPGSIICRFCETIKKCSTIVRADVSSLFNCNNVLDMFACVWLAWSLRLLRSCEPGLKIHLSVPVRRLHNVSHICSCCFHRRTMELKPQPTRYDLRAKCFDHHTNPSTRHFRDDMVFRQPKMPRIFRSISLWRLSLCYS